MALAGPPFLFGSRDAMTVAAWCALLGAGLMFAPTHRLRKGHLLLLAGLGFVLLCFGFVLHEQLADHPWVAPFNPIWAKASEALGKQLTPSVSIVRGEPFFALGHPLANVLALVLGLIVGVDPERARRGVRVMAWAGVGYAIYGIFALAFDPTEVLWREKTAYLGNLTATFINRNTAACYFGSCAAVWLVLLMSAVRRNLPPGPLEWRKIPHHLLRRTHKDVLIRFVMLFVCLSAMFMTSSRGGVLVSLGVMVIAFMIFFAPDMPRGLGFVGAIAGSAATALLLLQVLGGNVGSRIDLQGLSDAGRLSVYRSTIRIIADNPWFGTGLGTFAYAFPAYRSSDISMQGRWDIAHNTYLEFASELGIPLAIIAGVAWIVALAALVRGVRVRRRHMMVPLAALAVCLIGLLHSAIDFSLQIAGYSIVLFALLGLGLGQAIYLRQAQREQEPTRRRHAKGPLGGAESGKSVKLLPLIPQNDG
ncbi:O-antigen ligase family protein [uncultured Bradyrhizobium sp.]|uniref:O-antigen ligase family protein n=1 Tax=uncultured Bradyrhizobium sp. TaxID=199684 RepID=UPI00262DE3C7|nr:O-antigen ligase family protein [uncultured Bradyrhizobium sp.]